MLLILIFLSRPGDGETVFDVDRGRVFDYWSWDCGTGRIEQGVLNVNEEVEIFVIRPTQKSVATGIEMFRKLLDQGVAGDNVGVCLWGVGKDEVERGQVLAKPGSITPHTDFEAQVYVLTKEEGGRHNPFFPGYRPQFYFRTTDVTGLSNCLRGLRWSCLGTTPR